MEARVAARRLGGGDDVGRRREVGLAGTEADDVLARCLQRLRLGVDRQGCRFLDGRDAGRDALHAPHRGTRRRLTRSVCPAAPTLDAHAPPPTARRDRRHGGDRCNRPGRCGCGHRPAPSRLPTPKADIVVDAANGCVLMGANTHTAMHPASTAKIMTALVGVERLAPNANVVTDARAAAVEANKIGLKANTSVAARSNRSRR